MTNNMQVIVHEIATDGYPDMDELVGRVAFIWDGALVSGWPLHVDPNDHASPYTGQWEPCEDRFGGPVAGVTHWIELPKPIWLLGQPDQPHTEPTVYLVVNDRGGIGHAGIEQEPANRYAQATGGVLAALPVAADYRKK